MENMDNMIKSSSFINGVWKNAATGATFPVYNPATGEVIIQVADISREEVCDFVEAASDAGNAWASKTAKERATLLRKWHDILQMNKEELARIMTLECGKPLAESFGELAYGAGYIEWFAEEAKRIYGDVIPQHNSFNRLLAIKQPVGVVAAITPWNFPLAMITRKVAPALAAGCTVVLKPAKETPLTALALADFAAQAGIPAGVFNVITTTDDDGVGKELCKDDRIRKLSFTGSTRVGKLLMEQCASNVKKLSLELGGNAPFIVFDDANVENALKGAMISKYRNSGQTCVCTNRFLVQEGIYDVFVDKLTSATKNLKVGNGLDKEVNIGPLINRKSLDKVEAMMEDAVSKGGKILTGGKPLKELFYEPTVITNVDSSMLLANEEIFGPVSSIIKFKTEEEAIHLANHTVYGLAAYFYSDNVARCWRVAEKLEYGMVGVNEGLISTEIAPFGGIKQSGLGREGSKYGIDEYVEVKYLCFGNIE